MARKGGHEALARSSTRREPPFSDPRLSALHAYWEKERGDRPLPSRTDIDPAALRFILGHLVLLDVLREPLRFRIRLQGTELEWWMGGNLTGEEIDRLRTPALHALARKCLTSTVESRAPYHRIGEEIVGDLPRRYEALLLPLASDGATSTWCWPPCCAATTGRRHERAQRSGRRPAGAAGVRRAGSIELGYAANAHRVQIGTLPRGPGERAKPPGPEA